jgi:hypothetical protein
MVAEGAALANFWMGTRSTKVRVALVATTYVGSGVAHKVLRTLTLRSTSHVGANFVGSTITASLGVGVAWSLRGVVVERLASGAGKLLNQ